MSARLTEADDGIVGPLLESAADFLARRHTVARCKTGVGTCRPVDLQFWREMADLGWTGLTLPEALGGSGLDLFAAASLCEVLGRELVPEPLIAASVMPAAILAHAGQSASNPDLLRSLAEDLTRGQRVMTLAWQQRAAQLEPAAGVRLKDGCLHGELCFVPVVEDHGIVLVNVEDGDQPSIVAVEVGAAGLSRQQQSSGLITVSTVSFADTPILTGSPLLDGTAARSALRAALDAGSVCAAAQLAGIAGGALKKTVEYVGQRIQFGRPIGSFQTVQHRCVDLLIGTQLSGASWREAARSQTPAAIAAAKARCGDTALKVGREAVQMHGAMGFTEEADIGLYLRAALQLSSWLGTALLQRRQFMRARWSTEGIAHG